MGSGLPYVGRARKKRARAKSWGDTKAFSKTSLGFETDVEGEPDGVNLNAYRIAEADLLATAKAARERIESPGRIGGKFKRLTGEVRRTRNMGMRLDFVSAELLKLHADIRRVHMSVLLSDILNTWLEMATDYDQALFAAVLPAGVRAASVPQRYVGYLESLGVRTLLQFESSLPSERAPVMPVEAEEDVAETVVAESVVEPVVAVEEAVVSVPVLEDVVVAVPGWGSAAAAYTLGMTPGAMSPVEMLEAEQDAHVAELREASRRSRAEFGIPDTMGGAKPDA